jgi:hypothetical protein
MTPRRILAAGWLLFLLYAYPGYLAIDGADQLVDSRLGAFSDWHPAMMTEVWRIVGVAVSGPAGMLFLQSGLLLFGSYALLRRVLSDRGAAIAAACVLLAPPLLVTSAIVCAQAQLAGFVVAGAACLASARPRIRYVGLGLCAIAGGMGSGALLAVLPIVLGMFRLRDGESPRRRFAIALVAWLAIAAFALLANRLLVDNVTERDEVALAIADLTATRHLAHAPEPISQPAWPETPAERAALFEARDTAVREHPTAYLRARWRVLEHVLGIGKRGKAWSGAYTEFAPSLDVSRALRHRARHSVVQDWLIRPDVALSHTLLLRPVLYAVLALVLLGVAIFRRDREALLWLVSGIGYELAQLFDTLHPEYRDSHWLLVSTALAAIIAIARWRSEPHDERVGDQA